MSADVIIGFLIREMSRTVQKGSLFANRCVLLWFVIILTGKHLYEVIYKKLSYRWETARQLHMTTWAGQLTYWWSHLAIQGRTRHNRRGCVILWHSNALIPKNTGWKRILTWNCQSRSFKVIYFAVICRPTRGGISSYMYNIACRISKVFEHVAS